MCEMKIVDLSRYFLLEAAGDSESDHQESVYKADDDDDDGNGNGDDDDDDAESCSYDVGYCGSSHSRNAQVDEVLEEENGHDYDDGHDHDHHHHDHVVVDDDEDEDDDDDDEMKEVDDAEVTSTANSYASRKCVRSSKRKMSEVEKNRLFWEACLAS